MAKRIFVNYLSKSGIRNTDIDYLRNFMDVKDEFPGYQLKPNDSLISPYLLWIAKMLRRKIRMDGFVKDLLWTFSRSTFHFFFTRKIVLSHWYFPKWIGRRPYIIFSSGFLPNERSGTTDAERAGEVKLLSSWFSKSDVVTFPAYSWIDHFNSVCEDHQNKITYAPFLLPSLKGMAHQKPLLSKFRDPEKIKLLFVGSQGKIKGLFDLVGALKSMKNENPDFIKRLEITIISKSETDINTWPNVKYMTSAPNSTVLQLMKDAHIFCMPTYVDSYGIVFIEAMACCCSIIADNKNPRTEFFDNGNSAILVEPGNLEMIKDALYRYVNDPGLMARHAGLCYERYCERYSYEKAISIYKSLFASASI